MNKEKEFRDSFDIVGFHSDTIVDILKLIDACHRQGDKAPCTSEKLDELKHYTLKLQRYVDPSITTQG